jgi:hypothetical protein
MPALKKVESQRRKLVRAAELEAKRARAAEDGEGEEAENGVVPHDEATEKAVVREPIMTRGRGRQMAVSSADAAPKRQRKR